MLKTNTVSFGKKMYIIQASFEYLISILVTGSFLATLTKDLGISDSLTGILSAFISLGCLFQLFSMFIRNKRQKPFVIVMSIINQALFGFLYIIPFLNISGRVKTSIFVGSIFLAYFIYNIAHPQKINWLMSLVEDKNRGDFTANKEIISLVLGMAFSYGMGALVDVFAEKSQIKTSFLICAGVVFVLMVIHTLSMVFAIEKPMETIKKTGVASHIKSVFSNKELLKVLVVFVLYHIANYIAIPFFGTYQIGELGFSLKFVSILSIVSAAARVAVSKFWGKYADKNSFAVMIEKALAFMAIGYVFVTFAVPQNGKVMFLLYYICYGIAMGGINSALINLIFDYVILENRADSLAVCQSISGVIGFVTTLLVSPLITFVQNNGNKIFGFSVFTQQLVSFFGILIIVATILFIRLGLIKKDVDKLETKKEIKNE